MSSASSEDSMSEGEETSAEIPNCPNKAEVVSKLATLQKKKEHSEEIQNFLASYQVDAYKNVSIFMNFFIRQAQFEI